MDNILSRISRIVFIVALLCAGLAIFERASYAMGYTLLRGTISGGRLLEISTVLIIFVIAMLLREIRDLLRTRSG
jgi:Mn2+/Fe2+ NRAMP family transporter